MIALALCAGIGFGCWFATRPERGRSFGSAGEPLSDIVRDAKAVSQAAVRAQGGEK